MARAAGAPGALPFAALLLLGLTLPFEAVNPVVRVGPLAFTNLELLAACVALLWAAELVVRPASRPARGELLLLRSALPLLLVALASAALAPEQQSNALKFTLRLAAGATIGQVVGLLVGDDVGRRQRLFWAIALGALASALAGLGEAARWGVMTGFLSLFKTSPTLVGGQLRVSGSFQYATIAAMYFEATIPFAVALAIWVKDRRQKLAAVGIAMLCASVVALTLTRASYVTLGAVLLLLLAGWRRWSGRPRLILIGLAGLSLLATLGVLWLASSDVKTRLVTENDRGWYNASYEAPEVLSMTAGADKRVSIVVRNTGQVDWQASGEHAYALGYRWLSEDGQRVLVSEGGDVPLPGDVKAGESVELSVPIRTNLPAGTYRLSWGMLQRGILRFRQRDVPEAQTFIEVAPSPRRGGTVREPASVPIESDRSAPPAIVSRVALWRAALGMFAERPLIGFGPDNFRLLYGPYVGLSVWDRATHANNLYLELLADIGLLGLLAFAWLVLRATAPALFVLRGGKRSADPSALAVAGAVLAFLVHGLLDYFLGFTSLYLLFWIALGLAHHSSLRAGAAGLSAAAAPASAREPPGERLAWTWAVRALDRPAVPLLVTVSLYLLFLAGMLESYGGDLTRFILAGANFVDVSQAPAGLWVHPASGYDGQFYYRLALDPGTSDRTAYGITIDSPAYRQQRILYPALVWLVSLGQAQLVPLGLVAVNLGALGLIGWLGGRLAQTLGKHAGWGLLLALYPGFLFTLSLDLTEIVAASLALAGLLLLRRGWQLAAGAMLTLAVLARDTTLLIPASALLVCLLRHRSTPLVALRRGWPLALPVLCMMVWQAFLLARWGAVPTTGSVGTFWAPLRGLGSLLPLISESAGRHEQLSLLELSFVAIAAAGALLAWRGGRAQAHERVAWLGYAALAAGFTASVWAEDKAFMRALTEFYLLSALAVLGGHWVVRLLVLGAAGITWSELAVWLARL